MSGTNYSAAYQDALWRAYIAQDNDLRRLEARKRKIAHRRTVQEYNRRTIDRLVRQLCARICRGIGMVAVGLLMALLVAALCL